MDNFSYKSLTDHELVEIFKDRKFKIPLKRTQLISLAFVAGQKLNSVCYWLPVRSGKTIAALATTQLWNCDKILVVCPNSAFEAWSRDTPKFTDYTCEFLIGTRSDRIYKLRHTDKNIYIINYEGLKSIYAYLHPGDKANKGKWEICYDEFVDNFDCVIFDEVHKTTNYSAIQSNICYELSKRSKFCIGMSADPINKHYLELFNVYKAIDLGETFGNNFFAFRNKYFRSINLINGKTKKSFKKWVLKHDAEKMILERISKRSISFKRSECSKVPDNKPTRIDVEPSEEFLEWQRKIIENDEIRVNDVPVDVSNATIKGQKLLQLSAGFIYIEQFYPEDVPTADELEFLPEANKRKTHDVCRLKTNPKLDTLIDLINLCAGKILIWHHYTEEAHIIEEALTKNGIEFIAMRGSIKESKKSVMDKFNSKPEIKVLLVQQSVCEGFDAKVAPNMIFYTPVAGPRLRNQCEGRIKGDGQIDDYRIYDLIMKGSFDEKVIKSLRKNTNFKAAVMAYIRKFRKIDGGLK